MGSKSNPSKFDCYANAAPDEPMFVLLGRDPCAPVLVELWSEMRRVLGDDPKIEEALAVAKSMKEWLKTVGRKQANVSVGLRFPADMTDTCHPDTYGPVKITINSRGFEFTPGRMTYAEAVTLAGYKPDRILSVVYRHGPAGKPEGILMVGQSVAVVPGMVFNVADTSNA